MADASPQAASGWPSGHRRVAFIIAKDRHHAEFTMRSDLKWALTGRRGTEPIYRTPDGEEVIIVDAGCLERMRGARDTKLYLGYGYEGILDWDLKQQAFVAWGLILVDVSAPLAHYRAMEARRRAH